MLKGEPQIKAGSELSEADIFFKHDFSTLVKNTFFHYYPRQKLILKQKSIHFLQEFPARRNSTQKPNSLSFATFETFVWT
jgi:hypothetical protein